MTAFEKGSIVKLTDKYATALSKRKGNPKEWIGRLGKVLNCNKDCVSILWNGRKTADYVPHKAVELASPYRRC